MLELFFLGSGSGGNATVVKWKQTAILVDCGFSGKEIARRAQLLGLELSKVRFVLITHEHSDHVRGLAGIARQAARKIYCTEQTSKAIYFGKRPKAEKHFMRTGTKLSLGQLEVTSFPTSHDAKDPVGFVFRLPDGTRLGMATDTGVVTSEAMELLTGCDYLALESNHDVAMLKNGPYPWHLKQRILSENGHLSNDATAEFLGKIADSNLKHLFAMHLSRTNNTPQKAKDTLQKGLDALGLDSGISIIDQFEPVRFPPPGQVTLL